MGNKGKTMGKKGKLGKSMESMGTNNGNHEKNFYGKHAKHWKQDATHESEYSHVKHFCETSDLNSLVHFSQCTVGCGIQKRAECKLWGVKPKVIRDHLEHRKVDHLEHRIT